MLILVHFGQVWESCRKKYDLFYKPRVLNISFFLTENNFFLNNIFLGLVCKICLRKIERSDWLKAFRAITREPEFSRKCGFRRMLSSPLTPYTKSEKSSEPYFVNVRKSVIFGQMRIFLKNRALSLHSTH